MAKPEGYPLPWNDEWDEPYWKINIYCCTLIPGYSEWQKGMKMDEIIPYIDFAYPSPASLQSWLNTLYGLSSRPCPDQDPHFAGTLWA